MIARRLLLAACLGLAALPGMALAQDGPHVVTTFSILGDITANVGGERINLTTLVGPDGDAHVYAPSPQDARAVGAADLMIINGLAFEGWIERLIAASGFKGTQLVATTGIAAIAFDQDDHDEHAGHHDHDAMDPHAWQSVANVKTYARNIRDALIAADPEGRALYEANAERYLAELETLDADIRAAVAALPEENRRVITSHDAFGYFAEAYGLEFIAPQGVATDAEASARDVANLIRQIRETGVRAVFVENISDSRLIEQIARETGAKAGGTLYSDALSPADGPAGTYIDMMRHNIRTLSAALSS